VTPSSSQRSLNIPTASLSSLLVVVEFGIIHIRRLLLLYHTHQYPRYSPGPNYTPVPSTSTEHACTHARICCTPIHKVIQNLQRAVRFLKQYIGAHFLDAAGGVIAGEESIVVGWVAPGRSRSCRWGMPLPSQSTVE